MNLRLHWLTGLAAMAFAVPASAEHPNDTCELALEIPREGLERDVTLSGARDDYWWVDWDTFVNEGPEIYFRADLRPRERLTMIFEAVDPDLEVLDASVQFLSTCDPSDRPYASGINLGTLLLATVINETDDDLRVYVVLEVARNFPVEDFHLRALRADEGVPLAHDSWGSLKRRFE